MFSQNIVSKFAAHFHGVVFAFLLTSIGTLEIEMGEIERDTVLRRSYDLPDTILVSWISYRKRGTRDSSVAVLEHSATGV